jgi:hypothetical protein
MLFVAYIVRVKYKNIFLQPRKNTISYHSAGVVVVNLEFVGLAPGRKHSLASK